MANIMINRNCNLQCKYCFANEFVEKNKYKENISEENFRKALNFITESGETYVGIIGGEPTIHPDFEKLLNIVLNDKKIEKVTVFTNGILMDKILNLLDNEKLNILINVNSPNDIGILNYKKIEDNIETAYKMNLISHISLGINMYKPNFEYNYIINLLKKYNLKRVRTSIVVPNCSDNRNINALEYFKNMKPSVFNFFRELEKIEVVPIYDCNSMPLCITTDEEKRWLNKFYSFEKNTNKYCNILDNPKCNPVIDILPNLQAVRCFGCSEQCKVFIGNFRNLNDLSNFFEMEIDIYNNLISIDSQCDTCYYKAIKKCNGGCIAFKQNKIQKLKNQINLILE